MTLSPGRWDPAIHGALSEMVVRYGRGGPEWRDQRPPVATFDWDNTCIRGDIGESVLEHLDEADGGHRMDDYERMCVELGKPTGYAWCAFQIAGMTPEGARDLARRVLHARLADGRIRVRPEIHELITTLAAHGWDVWVVSASAEPLVQGAAEVYGVRPDRVLGMRLAADAGGVLQAALGGPNTFRQGKVDAIDAFIGRRPTFAAGDTETDIEMLQSATHRLLMERARHEATRAAAEAGGWWIQGLDW